MSPEVRKVLLLFYFHSSGVLLMFMYKNLVKNNSIRILIDLLTIILVINYIEPYY